ncbi:MAG: hypothetical protein ACRYG8_38835 [Janthinobacterium lividum]
MGRLTPPCASREMTVCEATALPTERLFVRSRDLTPSARRDAAFAKSHAPTGNVAAVVAEQLACVPQIRQRAAAPLLVGLACGQEQANRSAVLVADSIQLGLQPAAGAFDAARSIRWPPGAPFHCRPRIT